MQEAPLASEKEAAKPPKELVAETNPNRMVFTGNAKVLHAISHILHACQLIRCDGIRSRVQKQPNVGSEQA